MEEITVKTYKHGDSLRGDPLVSPLVAASSDLTLVFKRVDQGCAEFCRAQKMTSSTVPRLLTRY